MRNRKWFALLVFGFFLLILVPSVSKVKADPVGVPYDYIFSGEVGNVLGVNCVKKVNWTFFKNMFSDHISWMLEYKRYSYSLWADGSAYLSIDKEWNESGFWKFGLTFNVPVNVYLARFTFGCDIQALNYIEHSGTEIWLNYTANATETYSCCFNWSDIASIPGLVITKGRTGGLFWFRFQKENIPAGSYYFDPTWGYTTLFTVPFSIENLVYGMYVDAGSLADTVIVYNISCYLSVTTSSHKARCAIYESDDTYDAGALLGQTEERTLPAGYAGWTKFNFTSPYLTIVAGTFIHLAVFGNGSSGDIYGYRFSFPMGDIFDFYKARTYSTYSGNFPDPMTGETKIDLIFSIYANYQVAASDYDVSSVFPTNQSNTHKVVTVSFNITNEQPVTIFVYKKINDSGTFFLSNQLNNKQNELVFFRWFNATISSSKYWWKICVRNSWNSWKNLTYWFKVNSTALTVYNNSKNVSGSSANAYTQLYGWKVYNNFTGQNSITMYENLLRATGTHVKLWMGTYWKVWANYTGYSTTLTTYNNTKNVSGTQQRSYNSATGWKVWNNFTGNLTPLFHYENIVNATGTHDYVLSALGYKIWANYTGNVTVCNSSALTLHENIVNATGYHNSSYDPVTGWDVWANYTGNSSSCGNVSLSIIRNLVNATGTNASAYDPLTGWTVWANFTGNLTALHLSEFIVNATGTHVSFLNDTGYTVWANYTGNASNCSGMIPGPAEDYFLAGVLEFDPAVMVLSLFALFFYIGYESKKRSGGFFMIFSGFLLIALGILIYSILGYAASLVFPFAIFIMLLGGKKAFYGPETEEKPLKPSP